MRKNYSIDEALKELRNGSNSKKVLKEAKEKQIRNKYTPEEYLNIMQVDQDTIDSWTDFYDGKTLKYICTGFDLRNENEDGVLGFMYDDGSCYLEDELSDPGYEVSEEEMWDALQPVDMD